MPVVVAVAAVTPSTASAAIQVRAMAAAAKPLALVHESDENRGGVRTAGLEHAARPLFAAMSHSLHAGGHRCNPPLRGGLNPWSAAVGPRTRLRPARVTCVTRVTQVTQVTGHTGYTRDTRGTPDTPDTLHIRYDRCRRRSSGSRRSAPKRDTVSTCSARQRGHRARAVPRATVRSRRRGTAATWRRAR